MVKSYVVKPSIQLLALDIDGTLLNPQFQISQADMSALRRAHELGIEVVLVTGRRHDFPCLLVLTGIVLLRARNRAPRTRQSPRPGSIKSHERSHEQI